MELPADSKIPNNSSAALALLRLNLFEGGVNSDVALGIGVYLYGVEVAVRVRKNGLGIELLFVSLVVVSKSQSEEPEQTHYEVLVNSEVVITA